MVISRLCGTPCPANWPEVSRENLFVTNENICPQGHTPARFPAAEAQEAVQAAGEGGVQPPHAELRPRAAGRDVGPRPQQEDRRQEGAGERVAPQCGPRLRLLPRRPAPASGLPRALDQEEVRLGYLSLEESLSDFILLDGGLRTE